MCFYDVDLPEIYKIHPMDTYSNNAVFGEFISGFILFREIMGSDSGFFATFVPVFRKPDEDL